MDITKIEKIDFPQEDSPAKLPQYVLRVTNVLIGKNGVVLDSDKKPIIEAMQSLYQWNKTVPGNISDAINSAIKITRIIDLPEGFNYINCLNYHNIYPYGHLWDNIQPFKKIETLALDNQVLLIHQHTGHTVEPEKHFQKFGYDLEHQKALSFRVDGEDAVLYRVPIFWYSSMPAWLAHWVPGTVEWMRSKYKPNPEAQCKKLYLSRKDLLRRGVINDAEVRSFLIERGFTVFEGNEKIEKTIELFSNAQIIIGPHGSAFKNSLFTLGNPLIVEFCPSKRLDKSFLYNSISAGHLKHKQIIVDCDDKNNIIIDIGLLKVLINEEEGIEKDKK